MRLEKIRLQNFRNYENETFIFDPKVNLISGDNGQGKTNLLEAAAACSTMKLFRTAQKKEGLKFGTENGSISASIQAREREFEIELKFNRVKSMEIYKNGMRQKRQSDAQGILKSVLFCPDDLMLIKQGAAVRRRFIDSALCQLRPKYAGYLDEYSKLHEHKTRILRDSEEKPSLLSLWEDFSIRMAKTGAQLIRYRAYYFKKLISEAKEIYSDIAPKEKLEGEYHTVSNISDPCAPAKEIEKQLIEHAFIHKKAEISAKSCLSGPHKDDFILYLNGENAASFGSQGQIRTCTLSLKLAERELFYKEDGEFPVLLLDDVLSELDRKRQDFVLNQITEGQVLITCCEDEISDKLRAGACFTIKNGKII